MELTAWCPAQSRLTSLLPHPSGQSDSQGQHGSKGREIDSISGWKELQSHCKGCEWAGGREN